MSTADTLSPILGLLLMGDGQHNSDWGAKTNANLVMIEQVIANANPIGEVKEYYGSALPSDRFLWANGQLVKRTDYPALYTVLGTTYGAGDGSTTFALPDRRDVTAIGQSTMGGTAARGLLATARALGATFGEELHKLTVAELATHGHAVSDPGHSHPIGDPGHGHAVADPGHAHTYNQSNSYNASTSGSGGACNLGLVGAATSSSGTGVGIYGAGTGIVVYGAATGITIQTSGSGTPHNNMQPTMACNFIIRAKL